MTTTIHSNGSKWAGQAPDSVETLLGVLARYDLDVRRFPVMVNYDRDRGTTTFFGNFSNVSHVFRIVSDDPMVVGPLTRAIRNNRRRQARRARAVTAAQRDEEMRWYGNNR